MKLNTREMVNNKRRREKEGMRDDERQRKSAMVGGREREDGMQSETR